MSNIRIHSICPPRTPALVWYVAYIYNSFARHHRHGSSLHKPDAALGGKRSRAYNRKTKSAEERGRRRRTPKKGGSGSKRQSRKKRPDRNPAARPTKRHRRKKSRPRPPPGRWRPGTRGLEAGGGGEGATEAKGSDCRDPRDKKPQDQTQGASGRGR